jgi:enterochelin esterase-like enzyme
MTRSAAWVCFVWIVLGGLSTFLTACASAPVAIPSPTPAPEVYVPTATATPIPPTPTTTPSPTPLPTAFVCEEPGGRLTQTTYPGAVVPQEIPLQVYLPPCYDQVTDRYPTLILLHGKPFSAANWEDLGVVDVADEGIRQGLWRPFILVMPVQPEPLFSETDGGPGSYEAELIEGLLPYVDETFRTAGDPQEWAIAGISRGGVWALEIGFRDPGTFGEVAALSPALALNYARPAYDPLEIARSGAEALPGRIFLGAGDVDWARPKTVALANELTAGGRPPELQIVTGDHVAATWQALMPAMFRYLTAAWVVPSP